MIAGRPSVTIRLLGDFLAGGRLGRAPGLCRRQKKWQMLPAPPLAGSEHLPLGVKSYGSQLYLCQQHLRRPSIMRRIFFKDGLWQEAGLQEEPELDGPRAPSIIFTGSCQPDRWRLSLLSLSDKRWQTRSRRFVLMGSHVLLNNPVRWHETWGGNKTAWLLIRGWKHFFIANKPEEDTRWTKTYLTYC